MKQTITLFLLASLALGCGSKDSDKAAPPAASPPTSAPASASPAPAPAPGPGKAAVQLPAECKEFMAAMEKLMTCDKLQADREQMKKSYDQMLEAMVELGDQKAMADGCQSGMGSLKQALASAGC